MRQASSSIPLLDGIRGIAVLLVVLSHLNLPMLPIHHANGGELGVVLFFTLSGFLMAYHYLPGQASARYWLNYVLRRFFRVYPAFFFITLGAWLFKDSSGFRFPRPYNQEMDTLVDHWLLIRGKSIFWTIPVEIQFYLFFPLLALALLLLQSTANPARNIITVLGAFWLGLIAYCTTLVDLPSSEMRWLVPYLVFFIGGVLAGFISRYPEQLSKYRKIWNIVGVSCLGLLLYWAYEGTDFYRVPHYRAATMAWMISPLMIFTLLALMHANSHIQRSVGNPFLMFAGRISYSMYLLHLLIVALLRQSMRGMDIPYRPYLILLLLFAISWLSYTVLEKPFSRLGKKLSDKVMTP